MGKGMEWVTKRMGWKQWFQVCWEEFKTPAISAWIAGALAYMFVITNKVTNWDDTTFLFGKGGTLTSGRWGLDLIEYLLPSYSMPWLWGVFSIFVLSVAVCVMIRIFEIKSKVFQCLLAANVLVFPSQIGTMLYMFTSSSYAVAFLLATISVQLYIGGGTQKAAVGDRGIDMLMQYLSSIRGDRSKLSRASVDPKDPAGRKYGLGYREARGFLPHVPGCFAGSLLRDHIVIASYFRQ